MEYLAELLKKKLSEQSAEELNQKWEKLDSEYDNTTDNDFVVHLHERYGCTKEEFEENFCSSTIFLLTGKDDTEYSYEERSCRNKMPNIDFDKLFVGARLYKDTRMNAFSLLSPQYEEIEITHIYGGVAFYKWVTGKHEGKEEYFENGTLSVFITIYPKIIYKPKQMHLNCICDKTLILDEN